MPRCGAFGVRLPESQSHWPRGVEGFNAPVWGLRCATGGIGCHLCYAALFQCPGVGPSVCDGVNPAEAISLGLFQCPGVGPSVCDSRRGTDGGYATEMFQCPGVGPSVCDRQIGRFWALLPLVRRTTRRKSLPTAPFPGSSVKRPFAGFRCRREPVSGNRPSGPVWTLFGPTSANPSPRCLPFPGRLSAVAGNHCRLLRAGRNVDQTIRLSKCPGQRPFSPLTSRCLGGPARLAERSPQARTLEVYPLFRGEEGRSFSASYRFFATAPPIAPSARRGAGPARPGRRTPPREHGRSYRITSGCRGRSAKTWV